MCLKRLLIGYNTGLYFYVLHALQCESDREKRRSRIGSSHKSDIRYFKTIYNHAYVSTCTQFDYMDIM